MTAHSVEFQERLARIQSGQGFTRDTIYVGLDGAFTYVPKGRRKGRALGQAAGNAGYALSFPFCLAVGFLCHVLERYADAVLNRTPDPNANIDVEMVKVAVTAFMLTVVATHLLGLRDRGLLLPKLLGVAGGMLFFHNFVHLWPEFFGSVFSPMWVAHITSVTEPSSMVFRGIVFPF
jgi:hypothetical protein